jgi:hypothetical protein
LGEKIRVVADARATCTGRAWTAADEHSVLLHHQAGHATGDSRQAGALATEVRLLSAKLCPEPGQGWAIRLSVTNVGEAIWRTQPGLVGRVNLGLQLLDATGSVVQRDYMRIALAGPAVQPGDERNLEFVLAKPIPADHLIRFDLVAEHVSWFVENGRNSALTWGAGKVVR